MHVFQKTFRLPAMPRGFHLITPQVLREVPEISQINTGIFQLFIKHTSASLCINENADATVRLDFESFINTMVPENFAKFVHTYEGDDDMPAHLKSAFFGCTVSLPITNGRLNLGTWQGIYLGEHRNSGGSRSLVATVWGV